MIDVISTGCRPYVYRLLESDSLTDDDDDDDNDHTTESRETMNDFR